jgi:hypothetical protein
VILATSCCAPILRSMAKTYRLYVPEQDLLLPPSLRYWLPEGHLAYFVSDVVDQLDLSAITTVYEDEERGYTLYSVLFAVVAATCTSTTELGQSMMAAVLPMVAAVMVAVSVISNPATTTTRVLSLIPFFTPLVMMALVNVLMPPLWEVWLGVALLVATVVAASWVASKIFRYALLMTGKRPTLPELVRVVKAG